jgi:hypothetical protein
MARRAPVALVGNRIEYGLTVMSDKGLPLSLRLYARVKQDAKEGREY